MIFVSCSSCGSNSFKGLPQVAHTYNSIGITESFGAPVNNLLIFLPINYRTTVGYGNLLSSFKINYKFLVKLIYSLAKICRNNQKILNLALLYLIRIKIKLFIFNIIYI